MSQSYGNFKEACSTVLTTWNAIDSPTGWLDARWMEVSLVGWMRITKRWAGKPANAPQNHGYHAAEEDFEDQVDPEALAKSPGDPENIIAYDIVHSPSYQVPVLYMTFPGGRLPPPDDIHNLVVPETHRSQIEGVGPLGALSITEHPFLGTPAYFVHPCRTMEAMESLKCDGVSAEHYLMLWLGVIGTSVGLSAPVELARLISNRAEQSILDDHRGP